MAGRTVVYVGRLEPVKGLDVLLRAWVAVERNVPASRLVIAGAGDQYEQLVQLSKQLGIAEQVHFLGHVQDVMTLLDGADLYVQPSYQEGLSNSLMQAMAMGIAVVATRVSGNVDLVTDGVSGRLVEPGKSEALASAISELLLLPDTAAEMGRRAQLVIRERYDVDVVISKLLQAYRRAL
jgi:glycosyltransferase involved in cell wall biosynthesis